MNQQILFTVFEKAKTLEAQGENLIKLHVGQPDQPSPDKVVNRLKKALDQGLTRYVEAAGQPELIKAIAQKHHCQPKNVLVGPGSKWLIHTSLKQLVTPKKPKVIIFEPTYSAYQLMINDLQGQAISIQTSLSQNWQPNVSKLEQKLNAQTAAIILTSPNNPTSTIIKSEILTNIHQLAKKHNIPVLHDWAYFDLSFQPQPLPKLKSNHLHIFSFSKSFAMAGFRLGFTLAPSDLITKLKKQVQRSLTCVPSFIQLSGLTALSDCRNFPKKLVNIYQKRAQLAQDILGKANCNFVSPEAGFYLFVDIKQNAVTFSQKLLKKGVVVVPGTAFGQFPTFIRISLTETDHKLKKGLSIIKQSL